MENGHVQNVTSVWFIYVPKMYMAMNGNVGTISIQKLQITACTTSKTMSRIIFWTRLPHS